MEYSEELKFAENSLRDLISWMLEESLGENWIYKCGVSPERIEKWSEREAAESKRQKVGKIEERLIYYSDIYDLKTILHKHWDKIFLPVFKEYRVLDVFLSELENFRDPEAHGRELLSYQKHLIIGISGWIRNHIVLFRSNLLDKKGYFPQIESARDNFGNIWTSENKFHSINTGMKLYPKDKIDFEVIASDPLGEDIHFQHNIKNEQKLEWHLNNKFSYIIGKKDIGNIFITLRIKSNRDYHLYQTYDDFVNFRYLILPNSK